MKRMLKPSRWLTMFVVSFLVLAFSAVSPSLAKPISSSAGTSAALRALRTQGEQQCIQPPPHLTLQTLSDAQLSLYGLPDRRTMMSNPALWSAELAHYQHRTCGAGPALPDALAQSHFGPNRTANATSGPSPHWTGNVAYGNRGTYRQAYVSFRVPRVSGPINSEVAFWAGVGGDQQATSPALLVQAGVIVDIQPSSSGGTFLDNVAFWEVVTEGSCCLPQGMSVPIYPGDSIWVAVTSNDQNDGYDYFEVCNNTSNACANPKFLYGDFSDSATGECIGEEQYQPANFGTETLSGCDIVNNAGTSRGVGNWPHVYYYQTVPGGTRVSVGSITNGEDFPLFYCAKLGQGDFCG